MGGCEAAFLIAAVIVAADPSETRGDARAVSRQLDELIVASWPAANLKGAPPADDATFLRRAWLDLAGRIPPAAKAQSFLDDKASDKRSKLIEELLSTDEAANHWARVWAEYYLDDRPFDRGNYNGRLLQRFLFAAFQKDEPYDRIVRELLEGSGASDVSGPANLLLRYEASPPRLAGLVSKKFLGCTLQCAECHDHPHVHWKQDEFWGLAAYFARLRRMQPAEEPEGDTFSVILERGRGELKIPDTSMKPAEDGSQPRKTVYPRLPGGTAIDTSDDRRGALIAWLTSRENPYFARHFVSRTWSQYFGEALTPSLDLVGQPQVAGAASASDLGEQILELLAADFASSGYDVKRLIRIIVLSDAYQRSAGAAPVAESLSNEKQQELEFAELAHFARFRIRPLSADQLYLSIAQGTGYRGDDQEVRLSEISQEDFSSDLPGQYFAGQPDSLPRSVALLNGDFVRAASDMTASATQRLYGSSAGPRHIEWLMLGMLNRRPTTEEMEILLRLASKEDGGLADVAWALLNSAEFNSIH